MTKNEIIAKTLKQMGITGIENELPVSDEHEERGFIISILQDRLPENIEIKTCDDFKHLNVLCCDTCHNFYPHYEMKLIQLPDGSPAWVCDTVEWAIYPERYQALKEWAKNSPEGKLLKEIFGEDADE